MGTTHKQTIQAKQNKHKPNNIKQTNTHTHNTDTTYINDLNETNQDTQEIKSTSQSQSEQTTLHMSTITRTFTQQHKVSQMTMSNI